MPPNLSPFAAQEVRLPLPRLAKERPRTSPPVQSGRRLGFAQERTGRTSHRVPSMFPHTTRSTSGRTLAVFPVQNTDTCIAELGEATVCRNPHDRLCARLPVCRTAACCPTATSRSESAYIPGRVCPYDSEQISRNLRFFH